MSTFVADALRSAFIAPLDAELLLARVLGKDRAWLLAHGETTLTEEQNNGFENLVERRKKHEPVAYILGEKEFYGRSFAVDRRVLIPRPSTETLIDEVKLLFEKKFEVETPRIVEADTDIVIFLSILRYKLQATSHKLPQDNIEQPLTILDIGTGSGCIAITLAKEIPDVKIIATDISSEALEVAKMNAKKHEVLDRIEFIESDGLPMCFDTPRRVTLSSRSKSFGVSKGKRGGATQHDTAFLLVSNPPYIPDHDQLPPDVSLYEPRGALFAGDDGMDVLTPLIRSAKNDPLCIGFVVEMEQSQCTRLLGTLHE